MSDEIWVPVRGYEGLYEVSNLGRVRNLRWAAFPAAERIVRQSPVRDGYLSVNLNKYNGDRPKNRSVARLVLDAFTPGGIPAGYQADHGPGGVQDNRLTNLEAVTPAENIQRSIERGYTRKGEQNPAAKQSALDVVAMREAAANGEKFHSIARRLGFSVTLVSAVVYGRSWPDAGGPIAAPGAYSKRVRGADRGPRKEGPARAKETTEERRAKGAAFARAKRARG